MKKILFCILAAMALWRVDAANAVWLTDLPKAQAQAKAENKVVLMDFTGSDWCPGCIELKKKVFDTKKFQEYAAKNLVLLEVDSPQDKPIAPELKKANDDLKATYKVEGWPTLVVLDPNGTEIGRQDGYSGESAKAIIAALDKIKAKK